MALQFVTLDALVHGGPLEEGRARLAEALGGTVGEVDGDAVLEVEIEADTHEDALARVRDAIAAAGLEERFTFTSTTGTDFHEPGHRGPAPEEAPDEDEPPHLQGGSPHEDQPAPYDPPPRDVP